MPSLSKLIVERLPYLKKGVKLELKDYAIWRLRLGRWARGNSLQDYIIGPLPGVPDPDKVQDGTSYLRAVEYYKSLALRTQRALWLALWRVDTPHG